MPKQSSKKKKPDLNELASKIVEKTIDPKAKSKKKTKPEDEGKNPAVSHLAG